MKILCGALRGQKIDFKANPHLRPTADKVRKAIFDMLQGAVQDKNVLDLFSGTGAMGFEALSLGAAQVTFVEIEKHQADKIKKNALDLGFADKTRITSQDALKALEGFQKGSEFFDIIFIDPPYNQGLGVSALKKLDQSGLIDSRSLIILECRKEELASEKFERLRQIKSKLYGDTKVLVFKIPEKS